MDPVMLLPAPPFSKHNAPSHCTCFALALSSTTYIIKSTLYSLPVTRSCPRLLDKSYLLVDPEKARAGTSF